MGDLPKRAISAIALAAGGFAALILSEWSRYALIALVLSIGAWEFARMLREKWPAEGAQTFPPVLAFLSAALLTLPYAPHSGALPDNFAWGASVCLLPLWTLFGYRFVSTERLAPWLAGHLFAIAYLGLWGASIFGLFPAQETGWASVGLFATTVACIVAADSGAYFTGRAFGKRKLCPTLSAKKTWEGFWGGTAAAIVVGLLAGRGWADLEIWQGAALGSLLALTSVSGDLFISAFKRYTGVKDTSQLIPGHGGILDRFDSLLFSAPPALLLLQILRSGG